MSHDDADDYAGFAPAGAARARVYTVLLKGLTYDLLEDEEHRDAIRCTQCGLVSYHPMDVARLYCGFCHRFHER